ncbi:ras guanine nucleotide exchange factor K isoform X2 [Tasmannia lanceolata]|uniref:ras guanine nucleotide exchange factor K isoform X2 n=1 Tax=Tasmannia lanceolata TaxID=3420 RepID=UPI0040647023
MHPNNYTSTSGQTQINVEFSDQPDEPGPTTVPLLNPTQPPSKSSLFNNLQNFQIGLQWCALDHLNCTCKIFSYLIFAILAVAVPIVNVVVVHIPHSHSSGVAFDKLVQLPESALAAIAFLTMSAFLRQYGLRHLLFLDGLDDDTPYSGQLDRTFRNLAYILLPSFGVELAHKIIFFSTVTVSLPFLNTRIPENSVMFMAVLTSWVYRTGMFLLVCVLFRVTCELQILRIEGFRKMLEGCGSDAGDIFREHLRIKRQLWVISHRYRIFIIGCLLTITVTQLGALLLVFASKSQPNFFNSGDLVVCSAVQLSGFSMCLMGAARITHRAQGVVAIATKWHMLITSSSSAQSNTLSPKNPTPPVANGSSTPNRATDSQSSDAIIVFPKRDLSNFETRQALVMYLQHNNGGITLFGFALDRGLLHSLFAFEFSLVLWILSKVIVLS